MKPIGTGPYKVESFTPNDEIQFVMNENYREENKPFFERVLLKGGGDGAAAARAVLQTGEFDFAWGPGVEPDILDSMMGDDALGALVPTLPVNVERMAINHSDPWTEVDGQTSEMNTPHPALSDPAVRQAMSLAINRQLIADQFYGLGSTAAVNVINGDPAVESPNIEYVFDPAQAEQVLEEAGWVMDGDVRAKDGNELSLVFASPVAGRRQKTQAVIKANLEDIGFKIQLEQVDSGIFFDASEGNDQSFNKFPWDLMLYVMPQGSTRPLTYMEQWYSGPERENVSQKSNSWTGSNIVRWVNEEYDELWRSAQGETNPDALIETFIAMNDLVMENHVLVPVVVIGGGSIGANTLRMETLVTGAFSGAYANIANWNTVE
jgi:peptide/nickel transport system substrate-binding protein